MAILIIVQRGPGCPTQGCHRQGRGRDPGCPTAGSCSLRSHHLSHRVCSNYALVTLAFYRFLKRLEKKFFFFCLRAFAHAHTFVQNALLLEQIMANSSLVLLPVHLSPLSKGFLWSLSCNPTQPVLASLTTLSVHMVISHAHWSSLLLSTPSMRAGPPGRVHIYSAYKEWLISQHRSRSSGACRAPPHGCPWLAVKVWRVTLDTAHPGLKRSHPAKHSGAFLSPSTLGA